MNRIQWIKDNGYWDLESNSIVHTKSTKFLLPLVGITEMDIEKIGKDLFINVHYLITEKKIQIIVVLNYDQFNENVETFVRHQLFNENFEREFINTMTNGNDYLLIYNLPKQFRDDFNLFIRGKYSEMSEEYKSIILRVYGENVDLVDYRPTISEALYPTDMKRKLMAEHYLLDDYRIIGEVSAKPNKQYEAYHTIEELKDIKFL